VSSPRCTTLALTLAALGLASADAPAQFLGNGTTVMSSQSGSWHDLASWDVGLPHVVAGGDTYVYVSHDLTIAADTGCAFALLGFAGPTALEITDGVFETGDLFVGDSHSATLRMSGGTLTSPGNGTSLTVGFGTSSGEALISGGILDLDELYVGFSSGGGPGEFILEGSDASITVNDRLLIGDAGQLTLRPTANGSAGQSSIACSIYQPDVDAKIALDASLYAPAVGDAWDFVTFGSVSNPGEPMAVAPEGYGVVIDNLGNGKMSLRVMATADAWTDEGSALPGAIGAPVLDARGTLHAGNANRLALANAAPNAVAGLFIGAAQGSLPFKGGTLEPLPLLPPLIVPTSPAGDVLFSFVTPDGLPAGAELWMQWAIQDAGAPAGVALSNAVRGLTP
jgi:hypothetical protein